MKIQIENLPLDTTDADLKELFSNFGHVYSAKVDFEARSTVSELCGVIQMTRLHGENAISLLAGFCIGSQTVRVFEMLEARR